MDLRRSQPVKKRDFGCSSSAFLSAHIGHVTDSHPEPRRSTPENTGLKKPRMTNDNSPPAVVNHSVTLEPVQSEYILPVLEAQPTPFRAILPNTRPCAPQHPNLRRCRGAIQERIYGFLSLPPRVCMCVPVARANDECWHLRNKSMDSHPSHS